MKLLTLLASTLMLVNAGGVNSQNKNFNVNYCSKMAVREVNGISTYDVSTFADIQTALADWNAGSTSEAQKELNFVSDIIVPADAETITVADATYVYVPEGCLLNINGNGYKFVAEAYGADEQGIIRSDDLVFSNMLSNFGTLNVDGLTIRGTSLTAIYNEGNIKVLNSAIERSGSIFSLEGGGINNYGNAYLKNVRISRNNADHGGGFNNIGTMYIESSSLNENRSLASDGGGGGGENGGRLIMNNCSVVNNTSTEIGGAINCNCFGFSIFINSTITGNITTYGAITGGAIGENGTRVAILNTAVVNNYFGDQYEGRVVSSDFGAWTNAAEDLPYINSFVNSKYGNFMVFDGENEIELDTLLGENTDFIGKEGCFASYISAPILQPDGNPLHDMEGNELFFNRPVITKTASGTYMVPVKVGSPLETGGVKTFVHVSEDLTSWDSSSDLTFLSSFAIGYEKEGNIVPLNVNLGFGEYPDFDIAHFNTPSEEDLVTCYQDGTPRVEGVVGSSPVINGEFYTVTVLPSQYATITGASIYGDSYLGGTEISIVAIPKDGITASVLKWINADDPSESYDADYFTSYVVTKNIRLRVIFDIPAPIYGGTDFGGSVTFVNDTTGEPIYAEDDIDAGTIVRIVAEPDEGYEYFGTYIEDLYLGSEQFITGNTFESTDNGVLIRVLFVETQGRTIDAEKVDPTPLLGIIYNGNSKTLINGGTSADGTFMYSLGEGSYSGNLPTAINAGTYVVNWKFLPFADEVKFDSGSFEVSIAKATYDMTNVSVNNVTVTYDGDVHNVEVSGEMPFGVTSKFYVNDEEFNGTSLPGTYNVIAKFSGDSANYLPIEDMTATLTINGLTPVKTDPTAKTGLVYNGQEQALVNLGSSENGSFVYSLTGEEGSWIEESPKGLDVGEYTVYWKFIGNAGYNDDQGTLTVAIAKGTAVKVNPKAKQNLVYNDNEQALIDLGSSDDGKFLYSLTGEEGSWIEESPTAKHAGEYTVYWKFVADSGYNDDQGFLKVTIAKANPVYNDPTQIPGLTYTGNAQPLINGGSSNHGKFVYSLSLDGEYDEAIPTATDAGTYNVYWKFIGDDDHNSESGVMNIIVAKATYDMSNVTFNNATLPADGSSISIRINGQLPEGVTVEYYVNGEKFTGATEPGTYNVTAKFTSTNPNYHDIPDMHATLTITQPQPADKDTYISLIWLIVALSITIVGLIGWGIYMIKKHNDKDKDGDDNNGNVESKGKGVKLNSVCVLPILAILFIPWEVTTCIILGSVALVILAADLFLFFRFKKQKEKELEKQNGEKVEDKKDE